MDHLLSKDALRKPGPRTKKPEPQLRPVPRGRIGTIPISAGCPVVTPASPGGSSPRHAAPRRSTERRPAGCGAGPSREEDGLTPWPAASRDPARSHSAAGSCCSLTIRWFVTQARQPSSGSGTIQFSTHSGPLRIANRYPKAGRRVVRRRGPGRNGGRTRTRRSSPAGRWKQRPGAAARSAWSSS